MEMTGKAFVFWGSAEVRLSRTLEGEISSYRRNIKRTEKNPPCKIIDV